MPHEDAPLTAEITMSIGPQPKIKSGAELDYDMARKAAERIVALCKEAFFLPPEDVPAHLNNIEEVCTCFQAIADGLRLIKNH